MGIYPEQHDQSLQTTRDLGDFFTSELENPPDALRLDRFQLSPPGAPPHRISLEPKLIKHHYSRTLPSPDPSNALLLQLRNPLENVISWWCAQRTRVSPRKGGQLAEAPKAADINSFVGSRTFRRCLDDYGRNFEAYETWPGPKVVLGYEDLMLRPKKYFTDLSIVLLEQLDESFLENIPVLKSRLLSRDDKNPTLRYEPITRGEDVEFFRNMLTVANRERVGVLLNDEWHLKALCAEVPEVTETDARWRLSRVLKM